MKGIGEDCDKNVYAANTDSFQRQGTISDHNKTH